MSSKANIHADQMVQALAQRTGLKAVKAYDTDLQPYIKLGTIGVGGDGAIIKFASDGAAVSNGILGSQLWKNSVGLPQEVFSPHRIQVVIEQVSGAGAQPLTDAHRFQMFAELFMQGMAVDIYFTVTGDAPDLDGITGAPITIVPDIYNPQTNQQ
jgi:hypothetical protein